MVLQITSLISQAHPKVTVLHLIPWRLKKIDGPFAGTSNSEVATSETDCSFLTQQCSGQESNCPRGFSEAPFIRVSCPLASLLACLLWPVQLSLRVARSAESNQVKQQTPWHLSNLYLTSRKNEFYLHRQKRRTISLLPCCTTEIKIVRCEMRSRRRQWSDNAQRWRWLRWLVGRLR